MSVSATVEELKATKTRQELLDMLAFSAETVYATRERTAWDDAVWFAASEAVGREAAQSAWDAAVAAAVAGQNEQVRR